MLKAETPVRRSFTSMGTTVILIAAPGSSEPEVDRAWESIQRTFVREDRRFSRFKPESELSAVNDAAGRWVRISKPFHELTRVALQAALDTDGLFDPTVLPALKAAGYDRDYSIVRSRGDAEDEELRQIRREFWDLMVRNSTACGAWREIRLAPDKIRLPETAELDFGGIAKGWTVDLVAADLSRFDWAIVDAGGDLRVFGEPPEGGLDIAVEDPEVRAEEALRVRISSGALATTSVRVRSWGEGLHHLIDPRTSLPASTGVVQATVWAPTCTWAEVWSKAAALTGPAILDRVPTSLVLSSGEVLTNFEGEP